MIQLTEKEATALGRLLGKLTEKTSVLGYLVAILGVFGVNDSGLLERMAGVIALIASLLLLLFNDATVRSWFVRADAQPAEAMEPEPVEIPTTAAEAAPQEDDPMFNVSGALAKLQAVASLLPLLASLVTTVETALPAGTPGADKLKAVENALSSVYEKEQVAQASFTDIWPLLSGVASALVASFKASGAFTSSTNTAATPVKPTA